MTVFDYTERHQERWTIWDSEVGFDSTQTRSPQMPAVQAPTAYARERGLGGGNPHDARPGSLGLIYGCREASRVAKGLPYGSWGNPKLPVGIGNRNYSNHSQYVSSVTVEDPGSPVCEGVTTWRGQDRSDARAS